MPPHLVFWRRWLIVVCVVVQAFGLCLVLLPGTTHRLFSLLIYAQPHVIGVFPSQALDYVTLAHAVLGAVMIGWGTALLLIAWQFLPLSPDRATRVLAVSVLAWALPDTAASLWLGFWQNAVLNLGFVCLFAVPIVALFRSDGRSRA